MNSIQNGFCPCFARIYQSENCWQKRLFLHVFFKLVSTKCLTTHGKCIWDPLWRQKKKKKNLRKAGVLWVIFTLINACKTCAKTVLKLMHFCMRFETLCGDKCEKKYAKNVVFVSNFHFGKCVQNTYINRFEIKLFCLLF